MAFEASDFRQIMGHFATGVTVITTANKGLLHGMTANAIASLSLDPMLMLVCVDHSAHAYEQIAESSLFGVNVLAEDQEDISRMFAAKGDPEEGAMRGADFHLGQHGTPVLEGCVAHVESHVIDRCEGGDHTIFIGSVLGGDVLRDAPPLLFYRGGYRKIGG
jgi:flavin reductase (DIM6/NTAB) family NADH-FMN oxidoreductase RutF